MDRRRESQCNGLINAVNNAIYGDYRFKNRNQALKKEFLAGAAKSGIEYLSDTWGKPSGPSSNGGRDEINKLYMLVSRDPRTDCGGTNPLQEGFGYSSASGYRYRTPKRNSGFRLGDFIGTMVRCGLMESLDNLMFYEAGKAVEALGASASSHEGDRNRKPSNPARMQQEILKGQAPKGVQRVDGAHNSNVANQKPYVHFSDDTSLNNDGTIHDLHHGLLNLSNNVIKRLQKHGWKGNQ